MRIPIVVDANIFVSALLGGQPSYILFDPRFDFVTTEFTIQEVSKYMPYLAKKSNTSESALRFQLEKLPITVFSQEKYRAKLSEASQKIEQIDPKDVEILALALHLDTYLWTQDKDFDRCGYGKILKTYNLIS